MNLSNFAERLDELIFDAGLSPSKFAKEMDCTRATISRYLSGRKMPALDMVVRMADFFQCTTDFLLGLDKENYVHQFNPCPPFPTRIPFLCAHFNIKKSELIRKAKLTESALYFWRSGARSPTIESIIKIAEAFEISVDFILGRSNL